MYVRPSPDMAYRHKAVLLWVDLQEFAILPALSFNSRMLEGFSLDAGILFLTVDCIPLTVDRY